MSDNKYPLDGSGNELSPFAKGVILGGWIVLMLVGLGFISR